ncbi:MAG: hypothetical protein ABSG56_23960 [Bryobacteraceae bacterium]|jgi:hypothetical protein
MRLRFVLPALMIGAGLLLPVQPPALAKTSYKYQKLKKYKKYKARKIKGAKVGKRKAANHQTRRRG